MSNISRLSTAVFDVIANPTLENRYPTIATLHNAIVVRTDRFDDPDKALKRALGLFRVLPQRVLNLIAEADIELLVNASVKDSIHHGDFEVLENGKMLVTVDPMVLLTNWLDHPFKATDAVCAFFETFTDPGLRDDSIGSEVMTERLLVTFANNMKRRGVIKNVDKFIYRRRRQLVWFEKLGLV